MFLAYRVGAGAVIGAGLLDASGAATVRGQAPFLFATQPPAISARALTALDAGYNVRAFEPVAGERLEPRFVAAIAVNPSWSIQGQVGAASTLDHRTRLADQLELMVTPIRVGASSFGSSLGLRHEYTGATVGLLRAVGARSTERSALAADVLIEHPFVSGRDAVDVITTVAASRALSNRVWLGVEAVGSDLEGFWNAQESEGGATLLVGPTLAASLTERWRLVVGGGAVLRATTDRALSTSPSLATPSRAGYVLRTSLRRVW